MQNMPDFEIFPSLPDKTGDRCIGVFPREAPFGKKNSFHPMTGIPVEKKKRRKFMKKIIAFLLASVLCLSVFGTFGFASFATNDDHGHNHVAHAADDDMLYVDTDASASTYNPTTRELTIELHLGPSKISSGTIGTIGVEIIGAAGVLVPQQTKVSGTFFGKSGTLETTENGNRIYFENCSLGYVGSRGITITCLVSADYVDSAVNRAVKVKVISTGGAIMPSLSTYNAFICEHPKASETTVEVRPTCVKNGSKSVVCSLCGYVKSSDIIVSKPEDNAEHHDYDYTDPYPNTAYKAATCLTEGYGTFKCKICAKIPGRITIPKSGHNYVRQSTPVNGVYYEVCSVCDERTMSDNQCSHSVLNYELVRVITPSTCSTKGEGVYQCPVASCGQSLTKELPYADHTFGNGTVIQAPDCDTAGDQLATCTVCGEREYTSIPALGHDWGEWTLTEEASCIEQGTERRICKTCGDTDTRKTAGTGHAYGQWVTTVAATCMANGTQYRICMLCGDQQTQVLPISEHNWGAWTTTVVPTCTAAGTQKRSCSVCHIEDTQTIAIDPENHKWNEWETITPKTCLIDGEKSRTCAYCAKVETEVDPCVGHVLGEAVVNKKTSTRTCGVCAYSESTKTVKNGIEKTLTVPSIGSLTLSGLEANKAYTFELSVLDMETEAYYRQYLQFYKSYEFSAEVADAPVPMNASMELSINLDPTLEDYEISLVRLSNKSFYPIGEFERKDGVVTIPGNELIGAEAVFVIQGAEQKANFIIPIIITVATLAIAGVAIYVFLGKNKKQDLF